MLSGILLPGVTYKKTKYVNLSVVLWLESDLHLILFPVKNISDAVYCGVLSYL